MIEDIVNYNLEPFTAKIVERLAEYVSENNLPDNGLFQTLTFLGSLFNIFYVCH